MSQFDIDQENGRIAWYFDHYVKPALIGIPLGLALFFLLSYASTQVDRRRAEEVRQCNEMGGYHSWHAGCQIIRR